MKRDIDYIEEKFRQDGLETPESLSEEAMMEKLQAAGASDGSGRWEHAVGACGGASNSEHAEGASPSGGDTGWETGFPPRRKSFVQRHRGLAALAACLVMALVTAPLWKDARETFWYGSDVLAEDTEQGLVACADYEELEAQIREIYKDNAYTATRKNFLGMSVEKETVDLASNDMAESSAESEYDMATKNSSAAAGEAASEAAGAGHSDTYVQVEGIDEADIIKTDGKYIYHITGAGDIQISMPKGEKAAKVTTIHAEEGWFQDLYLQEDRLIAIGNGYDSTVRDAPGSEGSIGGGRDSQGAGSEGDSKSAVIAPDSIVGGESITILSVYDIKDPEHPRKLRDFRQSGNVVSSRMAGSYVYLVTDCFVDGDEGYIPRVTANGDAPDLKSIELKDICMLRNPSTPSYVVLSAIDIGGGTQVKARSKAVLGASDEIYCNGEHMYIAAAENEGRMGAYWYPGYRPAYTRILKADLKGGKVKFLNSARVKGSINNQFSMDEKDGYLRVATTSVRKSREQNNLYVLDEDMKKAGSVTGLAKDEHIEAVRFLGDRGYIITYRQTDPLFVVDFSNPERPKVDGSVKISGFSTLLVPVDEKTLLGIGYCTKTTDGGEALDGTKLALFDVSNPSKPKVKDSVELPGVDSPAQYEHKALLVGPESAWYAIPYGQWQNGSSENGSIGNGSTDDGDAEDVITYDAETGDPITEDIEEPWLQDTYEGGVLTFSIGRDIEEVEKHPLTGSTVSRAIYIDRSIYALDEEDKISGFRR